MTDDNLHDELVTAEATTGAIPITFTEVRRDVIDAMVALDEGYTHAPGDDEALPAGVRAIVERAAADDDRTAGEYWVKYRPAPDPFADGDGYEVTLTPARIVRGPFTVDVTVDTDALAAGLARARTEFAKITDALVAVGEAARRAWQPLAAAMDDAFSGIVYLTDGAGPGPVTGPESALAWLAYAETVMILRHPPKGLRKRAKARYLEVKRHLAAEHRRRLRDVAVNQFGAL
jgi:hypothetical protein